MRPPRRLRPGLRRAAPAGGVLFLGLLMMGLPAGMGQAEDHPGNRIGGEQGDSNPLKDCWIHHREPPDKMVEPFLIVPILPRQVVAGEDAEAFVQVANTWKQHIRGVSLSINVPGNSSRIIVPGASSGTSTTRSADAIDLAGTYRAEPAPSQANPARHVRNFTVAAGAQSLQATLELQFRAGPDPPELYGEGLQAYLLLPSGSVPMHFEPGQPSTNWATRRNLTVPSGSALPGDWTFVLQWGASAYPNEVDYAVHIDVAYAAGAAGTRRTFTPTVDRILVIAPGESALLPFPLLGQAAGTETLEVAVRAEIYYELGHDDPSTPNRDNYTRFALVDVEVGTEFLPSANRPLTVKRPGTGIELVGGEVLGFASAGLLFPSLLLGGTYGRSSRRLLNTWLGGARRRVMFHNVVSLGLTFTALVHIILFLYEGRYSILMGVLWGGLGSISLLVLGLTGYYQVPLIQKFGFGFWRWTHLVFGLLVVAFVAWHSMVDGDDFDFVKNLFSDEFNRATNLVQK